MTPKAIDRLDQIQASYIDTYKGAGAYSELQAALLKWRDNAIVAELKQLEPPEQYEGYAKLMGSEHCRVCGFNAVEFRRYVQDRIKQLEGAE